MRIDVNKYVLVGPWQQRDLFFRQAQELGAAEFITKEARLQEAPVAIQNLTEALHILRGMVPVKQEPDQEYTSASVLAQHIVDRSHSLEELRQRQRILVREIDRIAVFGDFSIPELKQIEEDTHRVIQFFFVKQEKEVAAIQNPEVIYVGSAHGMNYYVAINVEKTAYPGLIEIIIERSVGQLEEDLAEVRRHIDTYENELATLAHYKNRLQSGLAEALNHYNLNNAKERVQLLMDGSLFAVEAWIPKNRAKEFEKLCDQQDIYCEKVQVEKEDRIPTHLENKGPARLGQDLIGIYDVPSHTDRDPSMWVFVAFGLFFSMIVADAVYGLILLGISLFLYWKFSKKSPFIRRLLKLSTWLSIGCILWGIQVTSFGGIELSPENPIRKISFVHWLVVKKAEYLISHPNNVSYEELVKENPEIKGITDPMTFLTKVKKERIGMSDYVVYGKLNDNVMIEIAIFIGSLHIILSFLRYIDRNWAGLGWIIFIIGAYLYFPSILKSVSLIHFAFGVPYEAGARVGLYLICIGLGLAVILAVVQRRLGGLVEIMHSIGVFADVMSYLRIYALSLAGLIMAATFVKIGSSMPLYIGIPVILIGHTVNFVLALGGGLIHGLRLNFIEWYHYSFEGGGKEFKPLKLLKVD